MPKSAPADQPISLKALAESHNASDEFKALVEKCGDAYLQEVMIYRPMGGARSFDEIDEHEREERVRMAVDMLTMQMRAIIENIMDDEDLTAAQKAEALNAAAATYADRAGNLDSVLTSTSWEDLLEDKEAGPLQRLKAFFFKKPAPVQVKTTDPLAEFVDSSPLQRPEFGSFTVTKDASGAHRWLAIYSNRWYDRDKEVFPESEHREFVAWCDRTKAYPELWLWHTPGTRIGQADWVDYSSDGFAVASGTFDAGQEDVAEALAADKQLGVSHGFKFRELVGGVYKGYRSFEISPLPMARAANPGTAFSAAVKEATMLTPDKRAWLSEKMGPDRVTQVEAALGVMATEMAAKGVSFKEILEDFIAQPAAAPAAGSPAAEPAKTVPPGSEPSPAAEPGNQILIDQVKSALAEGLAPINTRLVALEDAAKSYDPNWTPKVTPAAQAKSMDAPTASKEGDPISRLIEQAQKEMGEAETEMQDDPEVPEHMRWHLAALGGGVSANGQTVGA